MAQVPVGMMVVVALIGSSCSGKIVACATILGHPSASRNGRAAPMHGLPCAGARRPPRPAAGLLAAAHEPADRGHHLVGLVGAVVRAGAHDAVARVVVEEAERDLVERRLDGGDLSEDVDAVAVLVDHPLHAADLALDAAQALEELVLGRGVAPCGRRLGGHVRKDTPPGCSVPAVQLLCDAFPGQAAFELAVTHALLEEVGAGRRPPALRVFCPPPTVALGRLDALRPGYEAARAAARR